MPYCVNCGVEVSGDAQVCPLCQTPVWHPERAQTGAEGGAPFFPTRPAEVRPASYLALAGLLSAMLGSAALCCGFLNLFLRPDRPWSFYVIGAAVMLWIWFVLPLVFRRLPRFFRLTADVAAVGIYVWLISLDLHGGVWFRGLALPILAAAGALVFLLSFLLRGNRRSILSAVSLTIGAAGLFTLGVECSLDHYFRGEIHIGWSLVILIVCLALIIPLRIIRHVPALREEARRRLHL